MTNVEKMIFTLPITREKLKEAHREIARKARQKIKIEIVWVANSA